MNTCSNCGATLKPDAKFCTTCGTRLNQAASTNDGWNTPRATENTDTQETSVIESVSPSAPAESTSITGNDSQKAFVRWTSAYSNTSSSSSADDPASRFISALEDQDSSATNETDVAEEPEAEKVDPASTWVTPTPSTSTWNYQASTEKPAEAESTGTTSQDDWKAPSTWGQFRADPEPATVEDEAEEEVATAPEAPDGPIGGQPSAPIVVADNYDESEDDDEVIALEAPELNDEEDEVDDDDFDEELAGEPDAAGFRDGGFDEVDYLSGDENIAVSGPSSPKLDPNDARARAIELVDELRRMMRMMPGGGQQDAGAAAMALTEASLNVSDFSDVREVLEELQENARDIQALSNLARKSDKIEMLLNEHASMAEAIETALRELNAAG